MIAVQAEGAESPKIVVIRLDVSMSLRLQRWLGWQKKLYIVDGVSP